MKLREARIWKVEASKIGPKTQRPTKVRVVAVYSTEREADKEKARLRQKGLWVRVLPSFGWIS